MMNMSSAIVQYMAENNEKFTDGQEYDAYFLEYWEGYRNSLHVRGNDTSPVFLVSLRVGRSSGKVSMPRCPEARWCVSWPGMLQHILQQDVSEISLDKMRYNSYNGHEREVFQERICSVCT